jgi:glycosyltransferase involved in cell wall biosynthesis
MRVLQITAFSGWGCTGRIVLGIHNVLVAQGCESAIAWGRINTVPESVRTIQIGNYIDQQLHGLYTRITDKCGFGSRRVTQEFIKKIEEYKPDLIQLHIMHGYYINLEILFKYIKKKNIPVVWTFHDCWAFTGHCPYFDLVGCDKWKTGCHDCQQKKHHPTSWLVDNSEWNWKKKKELFNGIGNFTIVTPSEWMAGLVRQSFLKDCRIEVINNGINLNDFKPTQGNVYDKHDINKGKKIVLGVSSSWVKSKGIEDFTLLAERLPTDYQVVLVGLTKEQKESLPSNIIGIQRTDSVHELAELYTAAEVFVNPTYEDNYPTTNLEALACGTPVVTYRTGGSAEAVQESGCGEIVDQGDIEGLKSAIMCQCKNQKENRSLYKCDEYLNYQKYYKLYQKMLGEQQ